ncbi:MAG: AAA family ATPase [Candidatus Nomurabacteria bacterium]|jgi:dephospho-CoA kinase|nr:AAA family ATPase [Candidatus Nomurabacteria bacterium]
MKLPEIIGVAGTNASGKNTLGDVLVADFGYSQVSTGDMVRAEAMKQFGDIERATLQKVAPAYKRQHGAGVFVELALQQPRPLVIDGIRALGEAKMIKKAGGVLVFVDADPELRYQRMKKRARDAESQKSFEEFLQLDQNEWEAGPDDSDYNIKGIKAMADISLTNDGTVEEFTKKALAALEQQQTNTELTD